MPEEDSRSARSRSAPADLILRIRSQTLNRIRSFREKKPGSHDGATFAGGEVSELGADLGLGLGESLHVVQHSESLALAALEEKEHVRKMHKMQRRASQFDELALLQETLEQARRDKDWAKCHEIHKQMNTVRFPAPPPPPPPPCIPNFQ
jgi:hypothetical protein